MKVSSARARQAILVNDGIPLDPSHIPDHIALFDQDGNRIYFTGTHGIPPGGTAGQVLAKLSDDDYDVGWVDALTSGGGGGGTDPIDTPYSVPGYLRNSGGTLIETTIPVIGVRLSEFPYNFDTTGEPLDWQRESPEVAIWFRVLESGVVSFDGHRIPGGDNYAYLYNAATKMQFPTADYPIASNDDSAGDAQPRITATVDKGDYILLYTGYDETEFGQAYWTINDTTTAVLADDLTGPPPEPDPPPLYVDVVPGPLRYFSVPDVGVLEADGFDGQPWTNPPSQVQWGRGRWMDIDQNGTLRITRDGPCTLGVFREQVFITDSGSTDWNVGVYAGQRIAVFCDTAAINLSIVPEAGVAFSETYFTHMGAWIQDTTYSKGQTVDDGGALWQCLYDSFFSEVAPSVEQGQDYSIATPADSTLAAIDTTANLLWPAEDGLGGWNEELFFGTKQIYYFDLRTAGDIQYTDLLKTDEDIYLYDAAGEVLGNTLGSAPPGGIGVATDLPIGRYYLVTQSADGTGSSAHVTVVCSGGASLDYGRGWWPFPS